MYRGFVKVSFSMLAAPRNCNSFVCFAAITDHSSMNSELFITAISTFINSFVGAVEFRCCFSKTDAMRAITKRITAMKIKITDQSHSCCCISATVMKLVIGRILVRFRNTRLRLRLRIRHSKRNRNRNNAVLIFRLRLRLRHSKRNRDHNNADSIFPCDGYIHFRYHGNRPL